MTFLSWVLLGAALVLFAQAGLVAFDVGLTRGRSSIGTAINRLSAVLVGALAFVLLGAPLMLGAHAGWGLLAISPDPGEMVRLALLMMLAVTAAVAAVSAGAERVRLRGALMLAASFGALAFPLLGRIISHVGKVGPVALVHALGGSGALALLICVGPRSGRFTNQDPSHAQMTGSNFGLAGAGALITWLGWLGLALACGAAFSAGGDADLERTISTVMVAVLLAGAAGGLTATAVGWLLLRRVEPSTPLKGLLAGVVAAGGVATGAPAGAALVLGGVAGGLMVAIERLLVRSRIDDPVAAVPIHLGAGLWGILGAPLLVPGLAGTFGVRLGAVGVAAGLGFGLTFLAFRGLSKVLALRLTREEEAVGSNLAEHEVPDEAAGLLDALEAQARSGDMTIRAPVEPFTDIGRVALTYNRVIETLQFVSAQTESLVASSLDGLITFNTKGLVTSSNPAASAIFGYSEQEFRTVSVTSMFTPAKSEDGQAIRLDLAALLEYLVGQRREMHGQRRSGEPFVMETSLNHVAVGEDEIYTATFRDITKRMETEAELARTQAEIRRRMELELENAKVVQTALLPREQQVPGCEIATHFQSASETGGDWYGYQHLPESNALMLYIGDVTGHGLASALLSGVVCGAVYSYEHTTRFPGGPALTPEARLRQVAEVVNRIVLDTGKGGLLMTMAFVHLDLGTGKLTLLNAGHNSPILISAAAKGTAAEPQALIARGPRLGDVASPSFEVSETTMAPGDLVLLYTDGLIENTGPDGRVYNMRALKKTLQSDSVAAGDLRDQLLRAAREVWRGHAASDDYSVVVVRFKEPAPAKGAAKAKIPVGVGSSRVDLQACKLEYSIVSPK